MISGKNKYIEILKPVVHLPEFMDCSMIDFAQAIRTCIETEQQKVNPASNAVIETLCNAARCGWELIEKSEIKNGPPGCTDCIGPCHIKYAHSKP